ncbi:MAG: hypothetical protein IJ807_01590 [Eubacterium sp.]|nr:hypothetical protein [Eubacterium sp.]
MKRRFATITLAVAMCIGLCACGGSSSDNTTTETAADTEVSGDTTDTGADDGTDLGGETDTAAASDFTMDGAKTEEWGAYTVSVPSGWTFRQGDSFDEKDERYCQVKKGELSYFDFKLDEDENSIMQNYNYNKDTYTNEQKDVSGTFGDLSWTGFQYSDGFGGYGFEAYTKAGKYTVRVSATFAFDSPEAKGVMESLKIKG